tara:strand:+ start:140 stop:337 length:198 start_codon:yes stop_codon:yes gene_type:complete
MKDNLPYVIKKCPHCGNIIKITLEQLKEIIAEGNIENHCIDCEEPDLRKDIMKKFLGVEPTEPSP